MASNGSHAPSQSSSESIGARRVTRGLPRAFFYGSPNNAAYDFKISGYPHFKILGVNAARLLGYAGPCVACGP